MSVSDAEAEELKRILKETGARRAHHTAPQSQSAYQSSREYHPHQPGLPIAHPVTPASNKQTNNQTNKPTNNTNRSQYQANNASDWVVIDSDDDDALSTSFSESLRALPISAHVSSASRSNQLNSNQNRSYSHAVTPQHQSSSSYSQSSDVPTPSRSPSADEQYARELQAQFEREERDARLARELFEQEQREAQQQAEHDRLDRERIAREQRNYHPYADDHDDDYHQDEDRGHEYSGRLGPISFRFSSHRGNRHEMMAGHDRAALIRQLQHSMMGYPGSLSGHGGGSRIFSPFGHIFGPQEPDIDNMSYDELLALGERIGEVKNRGLTSDTLSQLPSYKYKASHKPLSSQSSTAMDTSDEKGSSESQSDNNSCAICLNEFEDGDDVRQLPCFHRFHTSEIDQWLTKNEKCPVCNTLVSQGLQES